MSRTLLLRVCLLPLLVLLTAGTARAQFSSAIQGTVTDAQQMRDALSAS